MTELQKRIRQCNRCLHEWIIRDHEPAHCPKCKSPYWNKPRVMVYKKKTRRARVQRSK